MNLEMKTKTPFDSSVEAQLADLQAKASGWYADLSRQLISAIDQHGLPDASVESWKYADIEKLYQQKFSFNPKSTSQKTSDQDLTWAKDFHVIRLVNGRYDDSSSLLLEGLQVKACAMNEALSGRVKEDLLDYKEGQAFSFDLLSRVMPSEILLIQIQAGAQLKKPILILHERQTIASGHWLPIRIVVEAGENSSVTIVEEVSGNVASDYLAHSAMQFYLDKSARVDYCKIQEEPVSASHLSSQVAKLSEGSYFKYFLADFGSKLSRNHLRIELNGRDAEANLFGIGHLNETEHSDLFVQVLHKAPSCQSQQLFKFVIDDQASAAFTGNVYVAQGATKTDARQTNKNLLLSEKARVETRPQLEILDDDVKCSHGATVGQIDPEALFYMKSRAIDEAAARRLLTFAFAADVVAHATSPAIRERIKTTLLERFEMPDDFRREKS